MLTLTRQTRLYLPLPVEMPDQGVAQTANRWHSWNPVQPLASYLTFELTLAGRTEAMGGYLVDIRDMDRLVVDACQVAQRQVVWPQPGDRSAWQVIQDFLDHLWRALLQQPIGHGRVQVRSLVIRLSPFMNWSYERDVDPLSPSAGRRASDTFANPPFEGHSNPGAHMTSTPPPDTKPTRVLLTQQYEFSAAHRLHCPQWSEEQNRAIFGKCNYPSGHGHNYRLDVSVRMSDAAAVLDSDAEAPIADPQTERNSATMTSLPGHPWSGPLMEQLNQAVDQHVLKKLDHRFLNHDLPEFQSLNPTVENIAQVVFHWLADHLPPSIELAKIRIYETDKTWAEVDGR